MSDKITKLMVWLENHWKGVVLMMTLLVFLSWLAGYWLNGLIGTRFQIESAWAGLAAIAVSAGTGIATFLGNSIWNTPKGEGKGDIF